MLAGRGYVGSTEGIYLKHWKKSWIHSHSSSLISARPPKKEMSSSKYCIFRCYVSFREGIPIIVAHDFIIVCRDPLLKIRGDDYHWKGGEPTWDIDLQNPQNPWFIQGSSYYQQKYPFETNHVKSNHFPKVRDENNKNTKRKQTTTPTTQQWKHHL